MKVSHGTTRVVRCDNIINEKGNIFSVKLLDTRNIIHTLDDGSSCMAAILFEGSREARSGDGLEHASVVSHYTSVDLQVTRHMWNRRRNTIPFLRPPCGLEGPARQALWSSATNEHTLHTVTGRV